MKPATRNTLIVIAVAIIVVGLYFFLKKNKTEEMSVSDAVTTENATGTPLTINDATAPFAAPSTNSSSGNTNGASAAVAGSVSPEKFNTLMKEASTFIAKKDYRDAIKKYKDAIKYKNDDTAYGGLYVAYTGMAAWGDAIDALNHAISLRETTTDYWRWKLSLLDEKTETSFADLEAIYKDGLDKVNPDTKVNLVTTFAGIAENNGQISQAISLWKYAITLSPDHQSVYQAEIDRLSSYQ